MLGLLLTVLVVGLGITVLLWAGSVFLQSYFYTEPSEGIAWQAPAVGGGLTVFLMLWCLLNASSDESTAAQVPYDALFRARTEEDYTKKPAAKLWSYRKGESKKATEYEYAPLPGGRWEYRIPPHPPSFTPVPGEVPPTPGEVWTPANVEAVEIPSRDSAKEKVRFERRKLESGYTEFVSPDGWVMKPDQNIGLPSAGTFGRLLLVLFLNLFHLALWFAGLWLGLRYEWFHALGLAVVLWLVMTVLIVPMLLTQAGAVAQETNAAQTAAPAS